MAKWQKKYFTTFVITVQQNRISMLSISMNHIIDRTNSVIEHSAIYAYVQIVTRFLLSQTETVLTDLKSYCVHLAFQFDVRNTQFSKLGLF